MRLLSSLFMVLIQVDSEGKKPRELVTDLVVDMLCPIVGVVVNSLLSFTKWSSLMVSLGKKKTELLSYYNITRSPILSNKKTYFAVKKCPKS